MLVGASDGSDADPDRRPCRPRRTPTRSPQARRGPDDPDAEEAHEEDPQVQAADSRRRPRSPSRPVPARRATSWSHPQVRDADRRRRRSSSRSACDTLVADACTWEVSAETLTMKITSGRRRHLVEPAVPRRDPDSQRGRPAGRSRSYVSVSGGTPSAPTTNCSRLTEWALPGWYHVRVAALGGEPTDVQFELVAPQPATITTTTTPEPPKHTEKPKKNQVRSQT